MTRLYHDRSFAVFRQINRLARATGLSPYSPQQFTAMQADHTLCCLVAELPRFQRPPVGYILYQLIVPEVEIYDLAVHPLWQKHGIGSLLWRIAQRHMREAGATECRLEMRRSNTKAQRFYRGHGFQEHGVRQDYYREPPEDAILLHCRLLTDDPEPPVQFSLDLPPKG